MAVDGGTGGFCEHCGCILSVSAPFCPECGRRVSGDPEEVERRRDEVRRRVGRRLELATVILLVHAITYMTIGACIIAFPESMTGTILASDTLSAYFRVEGLGADDASGVLFRSSVGYVAASLAGFAAAALSWNRVRYWTAVVLCAASVLMGPGGFFGLFLGFLAFWMIISARVAFAGNEDKLDEALGLDRSGFGGPGGPRDQMRLRYLRLGS